MKELLTLLVVALIGVLTAAGSQQQHHEKNSKLNLGPGEINDARQTFLDMLMGGLNPNSYNYSVLTKGLTADPKFFGDAKKCLLDMLDNGVKPNADSYTAVLEGFFLQGRRTWQLRKSAKSFYRSWSVKGLYPTPEAMWKVLEDKQSPANGWIINIIVSKVEQ